MALNEVKLYMNRKGNEYVGSPTRIPKATGGSGDDVSSPSNYEVTKGKTFNSSSSTGIRCCSLIFPTVQTTSN